MPGLRRRKAESLLIALAVTAKTGKNFVEHFSNSVIWVRSGRVPDLDAGFAGASGHGNGPACRGWF